MAIPGADTELAWRYTDGGETGQQFAVRRCRLIQAVELWVREDIDDEPVCVILTRAQARFLGRILEGA